MFEKFLNYKKCISDDYKKTVYDIDFNELYKLGNRVIFFVISFYDTMPGKKEYNFIRHLEEIGYEVMLVSHKKLVKHIADYLKIKYFSFYLMPLKLAFILAKRKLSKKYSNNQIIEIGYRLLTDLYGSKSLGIYDVSTMEAKKHEISEKYKKELEAELDNLNNVLIPANVQALQDARSQGDLSENAHYDPVINEQARLNGRLNEIKGILNNSVILELDKSDKVQNGKFIKIQYIGPKGEVTEQYQIVDSFEADILNHKLSNESPFGKALIGHKKNETVKVKITSGTTVSVKILSVSNKAE